MPSCITGRKKCRKTAPFLLVAIFGRPGGEILQGKNRQIQRIFVAKFVECRVLTDVTRQKRFAAH